MTAAGSDHVKALDQIRDFFEELASLLLTADSLMAKSNWASLTGNAALTGLSYSLGSPRHWLPHCLYRYYGNQSAARLLPMVSVILGVEKKDERLLQQPLVTAALYLYDSDLNEISDKYPDFASWHLWMPERRDGGNRLGLVLSLVSCGDKLLGTSTSLGIDDWHWHTHSA